jgi:hypothetical protein
VSTGTEGSPVGQARQIEGKRCDAALLLRQVGMVAVGLRQVFGADGAKHRGPRVGHGERPPPGVKVGLQEFPEAGLMGGRVQAVQLGRLSRPVPTPWTTNPKLAMRAAWMALTCPLSSAVRRSLSVMTEA